MQVIYHEEITVQSAPDSISAFALTKIVLANLSTDADQTQSKLHFDNCAFELGVEYINYLWSEIREKRDVYANFGRLTHTIQDFYAHTNWVEVHLDSKPIPVWDLDLKSLPSQLISGRYSTDTPKNCPDSGPTHEELNKDSPSSLSGRKIVETGPNQRASLFNLAFDVAVRATQVQFEQLISLLP